MQPAPQSARFEVSCAIVRQALIDDALRLLHIDLLEFGHSAQTLSVWLWGRTAGATCGSSACR